MSIVSRLPFFGKLVTGDTEPAPEKKSLGYSHVADVTGNPFMEAIFGGGRMTPYQTMLLYRQASAVATAVDTIADEAQAIPPMLMERKSGQLINDHPVLELLGRPNSQDGREVFMGDMMRHHLLTHDACVYAAGLKTRPPLELWAVKPQSLTMSRGDLDDYPSVLTVDNGPGAGNYTRRRERGLFGYRYYDGNLRELYRVRNFSSRHDNAWSDSPLEAVALEARQQIQGKIHNLRLLQNGARLSLVAVFKDTQNVDEHVERRESINEQMAGADNAGKIAVISSENMELKEVGKSNKDMDFANLDTIARESVYLRYRIPLPIVSMDASTFNNMGQAVYQLYDRAVLPNYRYMMSALTTMLMPRYGLKPADYWLTYNPEDIEALQERRIERLKTRREIGIETPNELRSMLPNRPPIEGGDTLYQNATLVPVGQDLNPGDEGFTQDELRRRMTDTDNA